MAGSYNFRLSEKGFVGADARNSYPPSSGPG